MNNFFFPSFFACTDGVQLQIPDFFTAQDMQVESTEIQKVKGPFESVKVLVIEVDTT